MHSTWPISYLSWPNASNWSVILSSPYISISFSFYPIQSSPSFHINLKFDSINILKNSVFMQVRKLEFVITMLVFVLAACYFGEMSYVKPPAAEVVKGLFIPKLNGNSATGDAIALLGALVMPWANWILLCLCEELAVQQNMKDLLGPDSRNLAYKNSISSNRSCERCMRFKMKLYFEEPKSHLKFLVEPF